MKGIDVINGMLKSDRMTVKHCSKLFSFTIVVPHIYLIKTVEIQKPLLTRGGLFGG